MSEVTQQEFNLFVDLSLPGGGQETVLMNKALCIEDSHLAARRSARMASLAVLNGPSVRPSLMSSSASSR